ncbi:MAG: fibrillarin-like rRNA/tRNA 2'-O-methyltransferase [Thermoplasmata archaeon]|nr:fibrillarin-like rRNA/tRNA 2'-O-methyltransferase [Thermoplasmata archaeon]
MNRSHGLGAVDGVPRLFVRDEDRRPVFFTESVALGDTPVYGERWLDTEDGTFRRWEAGRSKLAAALVRGYDGRLPRPGDRWLYLGAASGTTVSHVADLVGEKGRVYAVERSLRPFARLLALADRYPNVLPIFADARRPEGYLGDVRTVDGLYADIAQPDQVDILLANARRCLAPDGTVLLALKTSSMGREKDPRQHTDDALQQLSATIEMDRPIGLEPFHKRHFLLAGTPTRRLFRDGSPREPPTPERARRAG